jgi:pilus assembly protein Flp/PilA
MMRRLLRNDSAATAVEYGLIAGLIAIGIVGSLVGTRTSVSNALGTTASQMGASTAATPAAKPPYTGPTFNTKFARAPFWAGKALASGPTIDKSNSSYSQVTATFTDGSQVFYTLYNDGHQQINARDGATLYSWAVVTTTSGALNYAEYDHYTSSAFTSSDVMLYGGNFDASGTPSSMTTVRCSGNQCSSAAGSPSSQFVNSYQNAIGDLALYNDILTR